MFNAIKNVFKSDAQKMEEKLATWYTTKQQLDALKEQERVMRDEIVSALATSDKLEGTENIDIGNGYKLKVVKKLNYSLDKQKLDDVLIHIEDNFENGKFLVERLVKYKPEMSTAEYKKLPQEVKVIFDAVVTTKEAAPSIDIVAPKNK